MTILGGEDEFRCVREMLSRVWCRCCADVAALARPSLWSLLGGSGCFRVGELIASNEKEDPLL